jgi:acetyl-CoA synthetase
MSSSIESVLHEDRRFPPSEAFRAQARLSSEAEYQKLYRESLDDPEAFFGRVARELPWIKPFGRVLDWSGAPVAKWFVGGRLNASAVCVDRHAEGARRDKTALIWEGEPGDGRKLTYGELAREVRRCANALKARGIKKGDRVAIYMPMVPELAVALLACARIGAPHSVIFGGFSAQAIRDRVQDGGCSAGLTARGGYRRGPVVALKAAVVEGVAGLPGVHTVLVVRRAGNEVAWTEGRDVWWHETVARASDVCPPEPMDSEDPLFLLYTSGSTGKPKGILHTCGG